MSEPTQDEVKELVRRHWDRRAATFDEAPEHGIHSPEQHERWLAVIREWTGDGGRRVLDVGCGTGVISLLLAEVGHEVVGVDIAPAMLAEARSKAAAREAAEEAMDEAVSFLRGDAERLALPDDAVEVVTARHLVWTLPDPKTALREWRRVLEPGGRVVLFEGHWEHEEPWDEYETVHGDLPLYDGRPPEELASALAEAGFVDCEHDDLNDPVLRGQEMDHEYYVLAGRVPG